MDVLLSPHLSGVLVVGVVELTGVTVHKENSRWDVIESLCRDLHDRFADRTLSQIPNVEWARRLYSSVGIDPTKYRPSSESLLRRAIKGEPLYQINTLVDVVNWCSLDFLLPIGLYDRDQVDGCVTLRLGMPGESYEGIRKGIVHVADRLTAADDRGPFGSPTSDSERTCITTATKNALVLIYAPADYPARELAEYVEVLSERAVSWCGGETVRTDVLKGAAS